MFEDMAKHPAVWLSGQGNEVMVVLSTRVRLARNVAGCLFPGTADSETKERVIGYFDAARERSKLLSQGMYFKAPELDRKSVV